MQSCSDRSPPQLEKEYCRHLGLNYKAYNSKYKEAEDSENPRTVAFRENVEEHIENFDELAKTS